MLFLLKQESRAWLDLGLMALGAVALIVAIKLAERRGWVNFQRDRVRRGTGNAALGLQGFIEPAITHVIEAQRHEHRLVDRDRGAGSDKPDDRDEPAPPPEQTQ